MIRSAQIVFFSIFFFSLFFYHPNNLFAAVSNWQKSVNIQGSNSTDLASDSFKQSITNARSSGANYVTLIVTYVQPSADSSDIQRRWDTPTDESLISAIDYIHSKGMSVNLKLHPEIATGQWRADIDPTNRDTWFGRYGQILNYYGAFGSQHGVEEITIGAETYRISSSVINPDNEYRWEKMIASLRKIYSGKLTYSANHGAPGEFGEVQFWDKLDYMGISAYFPLDPNNDNPTVESLKQSWDGVRKYLIEPTVNKWGKPLLFTELGYRSVDGAHKEPFAWWRGGGYAGGLQSDLYRALFEYWNNYGYMSGVHWWDWEINPNAGGQENTGYTPQNKEAEGVMKEWFGNNPNPTTPPLPTTTSQPAASPVGDMAYMLSASTAPNNLIKNVEGTVKVNLSTNQTSTGLVDIEVYDASDNRVVQKVSDNQNLSSTSKEFSFPFTANKLGTYEVKVGVFGNGWSGLKYWQSNVLRFNVIDAPNATPAPTSIPSNTPVPTNLNGWKTEFWNINNGQTSSPDMPNRAADLVRYDNEINNYWGGNKPADAINADNFVVRWTKDVNFSSGKYKFTTESDDGMRVFVDNQIVVDQWNDHGVTTYIGNKEISTGNHQIRVEYYDDRFDAVAKMNYQKIGDVLVTATPTAIPTTNPTVSPIFTSTPTSSPVTQNNNIDVWWPTNSANLRGVQPFKALVTGMNLDNYKMYWQVDSGSMNEMSSTDGSHKESIVDVDGWNWKTDNNYILTFVAKDNNGSELVRKDVSIHVEH